MFILFSKLRYARDSILPLSRFSLQQNYFLKRMYTKWKIKITDDELQLADELIERAIPTKISGKADRQTRIVQQTKPQQQKNYATTPISQQKTHIMPEEEISLVSSSNKILKRKRILSSRMGIRRHNDESSDTSLKKRKNSKPKPVYKTTEERKQNFKIFITELNEFNSDCSKSFGISDRTQRAISLFEQIRENRWHISMELYNPLLQATSLQNFAETMKMYQYLKKDGVKPDQKCFMILLSACARASRSQNVLVGGSANDRAIEGKDSIVQEAYKLLMKDRIKWKIPATAFMFNEFLRTCYNVNDLKQGWNVFRMMTTGAEEKLQDRANSVAGNGKRDEYMDEENMEEENMGEKNVGEEEGGHDQVIPKPDTYTFTIMIQFLSKNTGKLFPELGHISAETCFSLFDEMRTKYSMLSPDSTFYTALMKSILNDDQESPMLVMQLYRTMVEKDNVKPTLYTFSLLLTAAKRLSLRYENREQLTRREQSDMILSVYKEMKAHHVLGDADLLNQICCALARYGHYELALAVFKKELQQRLLKVEPVTFHVLLHHGFKRYSAEDAANPHWFQIHIVPLLATMIEEKAALQLDKLVNELLFHQKLHKLIVLLLRYCYEHEHFVIEKVEGKWLSQQTVSLLQDKFSKNDERRQDLTQISKFLQNNKTF